MRKICMWLLAAMTFAACTENPTIDTPNSNEPNNIDSYALRVGFEVSDNAHSRIALNESIQTVWEAGDIVSVFYNSTTKSQWAFQGESGDTSGIITPVAPMGDTPTGDNVVVLYPDSNDYTYAGTNSVTATTSHEQTYAQNSYGKGGNILVAQSSDDMLVLKSVYGWLMFQIKGTAAQSIKTIRLVGNNNEQLAGNIQFDTDAENASFVDGGTPATEIILNCGAGVALSNEATPFYIGIVPQRFKNGITIEIESTEGAKMTKTTTKDFTIERNYIQPMGAFTFEPATAEPEPEEIEAMFPANNQVWYDTSNGIAHNFTVAQPFDVNYTANQFGACANGECYALYGIEFNSDVTAVNQAAFASSSLTSVYLPHSITTIGQAAFFGSSKLQEVHVGSGIANIGYGSFANCINLQTLYIRATTPPTLGDIALVQDSSGDYKYLGCTIYVPESAVEAYKSHADWAQYKDYIRAYDFIAGKEPNSGSNVGGDDSTRTDFNHRILLIDHTGVNCGYCPKATDALHALASSEMKNYYNEVQVHGGSFAPEGVDPAYSEAASVVNQFYRPSGYPSIIYNFYGSKISFDDSSDFVNNSMTALFNSERKKFGADAGIAISAMVESNAIRVNLSVKSAKTQEYNVAVWVLENNIYSPNQNSNYGEATELHKTYNHALRYIATDYTSSNISGSWIGEIAEGEEATASYTIPLNNSWVTNNLEILVIASTPNANGDYEVVNSAVCPINSTKGYEYISDLNGGSGNGGGDEPEGNEPEVDEPEVDDNAIILTSFTKGNHNASYGFVQYTVANDNGDYMKLCINEGAHELTVSGYEYVVGDLKNCSLNFTAQQSSSGSNGLFNANSIKVGGVSKKAKEGTLVYLNKRLTINLSFEDGTSQKFVYDGN